MAAPTIKILAPRRNAKVPRRLVAVARVTQIGGNPDARFCVLLGSKGTKVQGKFVRNGERALMTFLVDPRRGEKFALLTYVKNGDGDDFDVVRDLTFHPKGHRDHASLTIQHPLDSGPYHRTNFIAYGLVTAANPITVASLINGSAATTVFDGSVAQGDGFWLATWDGPLPVGPNTLSIGNSEGTKPGIAIEIVNAPTTMSVTQLNGSCLALEAAPYDLSSGAADIEVRVCSDGVQPLTLHLTWDGGNKPSLEIDDSDNGVPDNCCGPASFGGPVLKPFVAANGYLDFDTFVSFGNFNDGEMCEGHQCADGTATIRITYS